jgi:hypothetical protein
MTYTSNAPEPTTHYVARIVIERVDHRQVETRNGIGVGKIMEPKRTVTELATLTLKSDELNTLVTKVGMHLELVEEIEAVDPVRPKGVRSSGS